MPVALFSRLLSTASRKPIRLVSFLSLGAFLPASALVHHYTPSVDPPSSSASPTAPASLFAASAAAASHLGMLPASSMPELMGRYKTIGVSTFYIQQPASANKPAAGSERTDEQEDERLELVVKAFYPSSTAPAPPPAGQYMTSEQASAVAAFAHVPSFLFAHLPRVKVRAVDNAEVAKPEEGSAGLPVVIYSHGLGGIPETYTVQACELASRGFVVLFPCHNDRSAALSVLPDGRRIEYEQPSGGEKRFRSAQLVKRVKELSFLIDFITAPDLASLPFEAAALQGMAAVLDRSQLALVGHSFGAATSIATASYEQMTADKAGRPPRVKAVVSHDQWMTPVHELVQPVRLRAPTMITISEGFYKWDGNYHPLRDLFHSMPQSSGSRMLMIEGSAHNNFSDVGLFNATLTKWAGSIGKIDHLRCWAMLDDVNSGWCGRHMGVQGEGEQAVLDPSKAPADVKYLS